MKEAMTMKRGRQNLMSNCSHRPIHDLCLSVEAVRVGQLLHVLRASGAIPMELKTDACMYRPLKRRKADVATIRFRDLDTLRAQYTSARGTKKLDQFCLMTPIPSDETVYRVYQAEERDKLRVEAPTCPKRRGQQLEGRGAWMDFKTRAEAEEHVLQGGSLLIEGIAGTGNQFSCAGLWSA